MRVALIDAYGRYDRAAICREAHRQFRQMRSFGWSFGRCMSFAWSKAKAMRAGNSSPARHPGNRPLGDGSSGGTASCASHFELCAHNHSFIDVKAPRIRLPHVETSTTER